MKVDIKKVSSELMQDLFEAEFEQKIAPYIDVESFEVIVDRDVNSTFVVANMTIYGTAGAPTIDDFKRDDKKIEKAKTVKIFREDIGEIVFILDGSNTTYLNSNDYIITYNAQLV